MKAHELDVPRIGYVHAWQRTQDEGWVRAALDTYGVPYTYFSDIELRDGNLRAKYDVIIYPHVGGTRAGADQRHPAVGTTPLPYSKTDGTPNLGALDQADDIRGGMGMEGLMELVKFVRAGGTLITEGSTAAILPEFGMTNGVIGRAPARPVRARLDHEGRVAGPHEPDRVRLRGQDAARLLQPGPGAQRRAAARGGQRRVRRRRRGRPRRGPEHHAHGGVA